MVQPPNLEITQVAEALVVRGELDAYSAPLLADRLAISAAEGDAVRLDLSGIDFIDSSGLRALVDGHQQSEAAGRRLVLSRPSPVVTRLLEISGLTEHLHVEP